LLLIIFQIDIKTWPDFCSVSGDTLTKHIMAAGLYKSRKPASRDFPILVKAGGHFFSPMMPGRYPLGITGNK